MWNRRNKVSLWVGMDMRNYCTKPQESAQVKFLLQEFYSFLDARVREGAQKPFSSLFLIHSTADIVIAVFGI